ncbi:hypothetical protein [Aciditerrimonas ferrireducens]|uniref:hypothetical protein n=1 Tax=Aciditerrimonas ferrireducens TaxID=667306 RepID=UPI002005A381|nr:hypothetical protein [Aciditerrimonas ferrireducens]MCK4178055.1 hypothetical protein [Aciditerrimonas ferrireducens]
MRKTTDGFHDDSNAQAVGDEENPVVFAAQVVQHAADVDKLLPMAEAAGHSLGVAGLGVTFDLLLTDAGSCSDDNRARPEEASLGALVAAGRIRR